MTAQLSQDNKVSFAIDMQRRCLCYQGITGNVSPEATTFTRDRSHYWQAKWSQTTTNRLLLQAGVSQNKMNWNGATQPGRPRCATSSAPPPPPPTQRGVPTRMPAETAGGIVPEAEAAVRQNGYASTEEVAAIVLETDGSFSVIGEAGAEARSALADVRGGPG